MPSGFCTVESCVKRWVAHLPHDAFWFEPRLQVKALTINHVRAEVLLRLVNVGLRYSAV